MAQSDMLTPPADAGAYPRVRPEDSRKIQAAGAEELAVAPTRDGGDQ